MTMLALRGLLLLAFLVVTVLITVYAARPSVDRAAARRWLGVLFVLTGAALAGAAAHRLYLEPRYGGAVGFLTEGMAAGSAMKDTEAQRARLAAFLAIYFSDRGRYPAALEELWRNKLYLDGPPRTAEVYVEIRGVFRHAHWYRDSGRIKTFPARGQADDAGGWGYVADPSNPEWGTVFVNCTHARADGKKWNMAFDAASPPVQPVPGAAAGATP